MKKTTCEVKLFVKQYFAQNKITQEEAGKKMGCLRQTIARHLKNNDSYFSSRMAAALGNAYGFSIKFLMYGLGEPMVEMKPQLIVSSVKQFIEKKLSFCRQLPENIDVLKRLFGNVNPDIIKGMTRALEEVLDYIDKAEAEIETSKRTTYDTERT